MWSMSKSVWSTLTHAFTDEWTCEALWAMNVAIKCLYSQF